MQIQPLGYLGGVFNFFTNQVNVRVNQLLCLLNGMGNKGAIAASCRAERHRNVQTEAIGSGKVNDAFLCT